MSVHRSAVVSHTRSTGLLALRPQLHNAPLGLVEAYKKTLDSLMQLAFYDARGLLRSQALILGVEGAAAGGLAVLVVWWVAKQVRKVSATVSSLRHIHRTNNIILSAWMHMRLRSPSSAVSFCSARSC